MTDVVAAEPLAVEEGDSMVIHMNPKTIDAMMMYDGDYCRLSKMGATTFYGKIAASPDAIEDCVHINDISIACLGAAYQDTLQLSSISLMWVEALEISCVAGKLPPGGVDELSELLHTYFGGYASRMVGLDQMFQVASKELYFKVVGLIAKPYDESDVGDGTYGTVTLDPGSEHQCTMVIKMASDVDPSATEAQADDTNAMAAAQTLRDEVKEVVEYHEGHKSEVDATIEKFRVWDTDGNGTISMQEMAVVLDYISPGGFTQADIENMAARADVNRDGQIDMNEFISWILT